MVEILDIVKKTMLTGIGLALVAKDEVEEIARDLEKKLGMTEQDGKKFLKDIQKRYDDAQRDPGTEKSHQQGNKNG